MAQSPFLKYQDLNGDKLPDVCDDYVETTPGKKCPTCTPSPTATTPNWKEQSEDDPWLNGKNCKYQTTIKTTSTTLILSEDDIESGDPAGSSILALLFSEYTEAAIDSLLFGFNKENSSEARQAIRDSIESTRFYLSPRPFSKVRLLYSVPYDVFNQLPEDDGTSMEEGVDDEQDDSTSENGADLPSKIVTYLVDDLVDQTRTVSQGLYLYNSYYKIYRAVDKGNLVFKDTDKLFNLDGYGHFFAGSSMVLDALNDLDAFLNKKKMNIPANLGGTYSFSNARVAKLEFTFTGDYKLNQLRVWTENCGSQPKVFDKAKLKFLLEKQSYKNPTVMGYLSSLSEMESDLTARSPMPWLEFIKKFTYPTVEERTDFGGIGTATATDAAQAGSCVAEALSSGAKQLGQDLLDDAFSMVDVIAYQFHKNMCKRSLGEETEERVRIGMIYDPDSGIEGENRTFFAFAEEQAYKELTKNKDICALFMGAASGEGPPESLERFYENSLAPLKLCGLNAMYLEVISCLMGQLPFEEAMSKILEATLRGMSWENFENLFIGLPHPKRVELSQLARSKLASGNIFQSDSNMGTLARSIDNTALPGTPLTSHQLSSIELPWRRGNNPSPQGISLETDLPADINHSADTNFEEVGDPRYMTAEQLQAYSGQRSTLAQTFTAAGGGNLNNKDVFEAYIKALLETYN